MGEHVGVYVAEIWRLITLTEFTRDGLEKAM